MEIFKLVGKIMVDTANAENSIAKTDKKAESLGQTIAGGAKTVAKWGAGFIAAAAAVGAAVFSVASDVAQAGDKIAKGADRMGITTDQYQELAYVASRCGVEFGVMERAAKKLEGTDIDLGTALNNIMSIDDAAVRTKSAIDLFGESVAYELGPMLNIGGEEFDKLKERVHDLGGVMDEDAVAASAAFQDAVTDLKTAFTGFKNNLVGNFLPGLTKVVNWVTDKAIPAFNWLLDLFANLPEKTMAAAQAVGQVYVDNYDLASQLGIPHAAGLARVPYDNYRATLHRGETVLNANDTSQLVDLLKNGTGGGEPVNITIQNVLDGKIIGEYSYQYSRRKERALGV